MNSKFQILRTSLAAMVCDVMSIRIAVALLQLNRLYALAAPIPANAYSAAALIGHALARLHLNAGVLHINTAICHR